MSVLVDTNVLSRRTQPGHPQYNAAVESVIRLVAAPAPLCCCRKTRAAATIVAVVPVTHSPPQLPEYLQHLLEEQVAPPAEIPLAPAEGAAYWRESAGGLPHTARLSDEAISRESIYSSRG